MESYVTSILTTSQEIAAVGKPLDDELVATLLLRGLTSEYQPMKLALENSGVEITTDYIKTKLLQEEYNPRGKQFKAHVTYVIEKVTRLRIASGIQIDQTFTRP
ncbi:hypothetical protein QE152_g10391 [Popillia japonica]|uniref:Uncharacterized protein n=1 Tax=Popillia japonica TaxID=7064 RepID=A0AAW1LVD8_POPJA